MITKMYQLVTKIVTPTLDVVFDVFTWFQTLTIYCCLLGLFTRNSLMSIALEIKLHMFESIRHMTNSNF